MIPVMTILNAFDLILKNKENLIALNQIAAKTLQEYTTAKHSNRDIIIGLRKALYSVMRDSKKTIRTIETAEKIISEAGEIIKKLKKEKD